MNDEQSEIWEYLNTHAVGFENRKSSTEIRDTLHLNSGGPTNEHVRELIRDMVFNHGCLIGSLMYRKGYWIIQNPEELDMVIRHLNSRAHKVLERADALKGNWDDRSSK